MVACTWHGCVSQQTKNLPAQLEASLHNQPSERKVSVSSINSLYSKNEYHTLFINKCIFTFSSVVLVGFNLELHSTCNINERLLLSSNKWSEITESPSQSFFLRSCNSPQPPQQETCHRPPATQGTWRGKRWGVNIPKETEVWLCLLSLKTYVSVLTVSSFRPTIGLSISRSRRLVQGDKSTFNIISSLVSLWCVTLSYVFRSDTGGGIYMPHLHMWSRTQQMR